MEEQMAPPSGGVSIPAPSLQFSIRGDDNLTIKEIPLRVAAEFVARNHYSKVMPRLNKIIFGLYQKEDLVGCITFGWGVRPLDTIKKLFPSLKSTDYLEIGKLCLLDSMPKNTESRFITAAMRFLKQLRPELKLVFTWADAIWGKPGFIYQASNFLFGGCIGSEAYRTEEGYRLHPRQLHKYLVFKGEIGKGQKGRRVTSKEASENPSTALGNWAPNNGKVGVRRPYASDLARLGMSHVRGLQFRYIYFLCPVKEQQSLLLTSSVLWHRDYPKVQDCAWKIKNGGAQWREWVPSDKVFTGAFDGR